MTGGFMYNRNPSLSFLKMMTTSKQILNIDIRKVCLLIICVDSDQTKNLQNITDTPSQM